MTGLRAIRGAVQLDRDEREHLLACTADLVAAGADEMTIAIPRAAIPRKKVLTKRVPTSEATGTRKNIDSPRSPTTALRSQLPYLTARG